MTKLPDNKAPAQIFIIFPPFSSPALRGEEMDGDDLSHAYRSSGPDRYKRSIHRLLCEDY